VWDTDLPTQLQHAIFTHPALEKSGAAHSATVNLQNVRAMAGGRAAAAASLTKRNKG
jgi:hypothetical protein